MNQNERFFRYFKLEMEALHQQMSRLGDTALVGGERVDATDHFLAGITRLSNEVKDASVYIPAYDQRKYTEEIKTLNREFNDTRTAFAPKPKFAFKTQRKNASAISLEDAEALASEQRLNIPGYDSRATSASAHSSLPASPYHGAATIPAPAEESIPPLLSGSIAGEDIAYNAGEGASADPATPASSVNSNIVITNRSNTHIALPPASSNSKNATTAALTHLTHCILTSTTNPPAALTSLTLRTIYTTLLLLSQPILGPIHATNLHRVVLIASCAQFRLHDSSDVDVYLTCGSRPVIERCSGVRFAPLPAAADAEGGGGGGGSGFWYQVDDFQWVRSGQSPNWSVLPLENRIQEQTWTEVLKLGGAAVGTRGVEEVLGLVGLE